MRLRTEGKVKETEDLEIQHGLFPEDSLSPLLCRISLIPLTEQMNKLNAGYQEHTTYTKISRLLYMYNLKIIGKTQEELQKQVQVVRTFSDDTNMEFGVQRCAKVTLKTVTLVHRCAKVALKTVTLVHRCAKAALKTVTLVHSHNLILDFKSDIQELEQGKTYKHLGTEESEGMQHQHTKERMKTKYTRRLRMILKSVVNAKNKITATGALAVPVLKYSFRIINWRLEEIRK